MHEILKYIKILRIISKIPEKGKISVCEDNIFIYDDTMVNWILRKIYNDSKETTVKFLENFYTELCNFTDRLVTEIGVDLSNSSRQKKKTLLISLISKMKLSVMGLDNLIVTYKLYPSTVSMLELIKSDIVLPQFNVLSKFLPNRPKKKRRMSL